MSSLHPWPLTLSQEPPCKQPALKLQDSFGAGVFLCCTLQRSFVKHCPALWLECLKVAIFYSPVQLSCLGLLMALTQFTYLLLYPTRLEALCTPIGFSKVTGNQLVIFYSNMQTNSGAIITFLSIAALIGSKGCDSTFSV